MARLKVKDNLKMIGGVWNRPIGENDRERSIRLSEEDTVISQSEALKQVEALCGSLERCCGNERYEKFVNPALAACLEASTIEQFGFSVLRQASALPNAGTGVFVHKGNVPKHQIVSLFPGTIYTPGEPCFLQSLANSYVFRCSDGIIIDGNNRGLSRLLFSSCSYRDRMGPWLVSDLTWLNLGQPANPFNVGQYVNNQTKDRTANVCYQEIDLPLTEFPSRLRRFIPNVYYSSLNTGNPKLERREYVNVKCGSSSCGSKTSSHKLIGTNNTCDQSVL